jgi:hypothetical protein
MRLILVDNEDRSLKFIFGSCPVIQVYFVGVFALLSGRGILFSIGI